MPFDERFPYIPYINIKTVLICEKFGENNGVSQGYKGSIRAILGELEAFQILTLKDEAAIERVFGYRGLSKIRPYKCSFEKILEFEQIF